MSEHHPEAKGEPVSGNLFRWLVEDSPDIVTITDLDLRIGYVNPAVTLTLGYSADELIGKDALGLLHPDDVPAALAAISRGLGQPNIPQYLQHRLRHKNGTWRLFESAGRYVPDERRPRLVLCARDVTERQRMEDALDESRRALTTLLGDLPGMAYRCRNDPQWTMEFVSERCLDLTGYDPSGLMGNRKVAYADLIHPDDRERVWKDVQSALLAKNPFEIIYRIRTARGEEKWVWDRGRAVLGLDGALLALEGFVIDITEQRRAEEKLRESEAKFRTLSEQSPNMIFINKGGRVVYANAKCEEVTGYTREELCAPNFDFRTLIAASSRPIVEENLRRHLRGEEIPPYEYVVVTRDGRHVDGLHTTRLIDYEGERAILGIITDVTARKQMEEALRQSEKKYRDLVDNAPVGIYRTTLDGRILYVNDALARALEFDSPEEVMSSNVALRYRDKREREAFLADLKASKKIDNLEVDILTKNGGVRTVLISAVLEGDALSGMIRDITDRKRAEEEKDRLQAELLQAQKLESIGRLAGGVAHDFNNLLTVINGYSEVVLEQLGADGSLRKDVEEIKRAGERAAALTQQLLAFSRRQVLQEQVLDLSVVVRNLEKMLGRLIGENIQIVTGLADPLWRVRADPGQMDQVLLNLAINARDAMPDGGQLHIEARNVELDAAFARRHPETEIRRGPYVQLSVRDTGRGIDEEAQRLIFEPFFTTKEKGKGTGLGLATVYGIVKQSGGYIWVESKLGSGTTFNIYLPRLDEEGASPARRGLIRGSETILLVAKRDRTVRALASRILRSCGYRLLIASSAAEAARIAEEHPQAIHLVLTDTGLPSSELLGLIERMMPAHPNVKAILISGNEEQAKASRGLDPRVTPVSKPFSVTSLAEKVREVLDETVRD